VLLGLIICLIGAVLLGSGIAQTVVSDSAMIEYDRRVAEKHKAVFPAAGVVPDEETAKSIALAVAIPIWGKDKVTSELPLRAGLKGNVWTVIGDPHLHGGQTGGELIIQLDKRTGAVLSFLHTQ
jgi:NTF2 fold immunity protein